MRATKIVATLGPASSSAEVLKKLMEAGVDVVRLNFSHGTAADHQARAQLVREVSKAAGREVAIMADLQGPKIRVGKFAEGKVIRIKSWCEAQDQSMEGAVFYSDSHNDLPLLQAVDKPVAVDPDERLKSEALRNGWDIISLRD